MEGNRNFQPSGPEEMPQDVLLNQFGDVPIPNFLQDMTSVGFPSAQDFQSMAHVSNLGCNGNQVPHQEILNYLNSAQPFAPSSLPPSENWPGKYAFKVTFNGQENVKNLSWVFSTVKNKLFVKKDALCPVNFSTSVPMTGDVYIRAKALFSSSAYSKDIVQRCLNHSMDELKEGKVEAEHLIRCDSRRAYYEVDQLTRHHSVVVPFENPAAGQSFSSYNYEFKCFTSCSGGPNRRPLMMMFILEKGTEIIGRCRVDLKVCACPVRDKYQEEKETWSDTATQSEKKRKQPSASSSHRPGPSKKVKLPSSSTQSSEDENGPFIIKVKDKKCFLFLKQLQKWYYIYSTFKSQLPNDFKLLVYSSLSSDEDDQKSKNK